MKSLIGSHDGLLHQRRPEHRDRYLRDGIAIRLCRCCHRRRADGAAPAGLVIDDDRLTKIFGCDLGYGTHNDVG